MKYANWILFILIILIIIPLFFNVPVYPTDPGQNRLIEKTEKIENIRTFARLYGLARYFYPGDEAAETDWERFAVYGVKQVEQAENPRQLKQILDELFLPVAPALMIHESGRDPGFSLARITPPGADRNSKKNITAWQHRGIGFGEPGGMFQSVRVNRPVKDYFKHAYGAAANRIDAAPYRGKTIKLKAAVKVSMGRGQLWLRVDRAGNQPGFFNDMDETPILPGEWKYYEITGPVAKDAEAISFGCLLRGAGRLGCDDFQLYFADTPSGSGKPLEWRPLLLNNPGFEEDKEGSAPAGWLARSEAYAFPVASAAAFKGRFGVTIKSLAPPPARPLFSGMPGIGETVTKELGRGLSCTFPLALYIDGSRTYPPAPARRVQRLKAAYKDSLSAEQVRPDNVVEGLAGIVITWNVLTHFYPYFGDVETDWDAALTEALEATFKNRGHQGYLDTLRRMLAHLQDGQAGAYMAGNTKRMYLPPVDWDWVGEQLVITAVYDQKQTRLLVGDIVLQVNGLKPGDALKNKETGISGATPHWKRFRALEELLRGKKNTHLRLKVKRQGSEAVMEETLVRSAFSPAYYGYREKQKRKSGGLGDGIFYLNADVTPRSEIDRLMPELQKARGIIYDLRGSPKDNPPLICHRLKTGQVFTSMQMPLVTYPDYQKVSYRPLEWRLPPLRPFLKARMVFICGRGTIGNAESLLNVIQHLKLGPIVGRPSAGAAGSVNSFYLFGKYFIRWTGIKTLKPDGSPHHGKGIIPGIQVERTLEGIKAHHDELLEKARGLFSRKPPP
jgi:C-terminal processing protease CtpA/Prc